MDLTQVLVAACGVVQVFGLFILSDIRARVMRLEDRAMPTPERISGGAFHP